MGSAKQDIVIEQGSNFRLVVSVVGGPENITGYTGKMQVRKIKASSEVLAQADEGEVTVNPVTRQLVVDIPATQTALYEWDNGAVYDIVLSGGGGSWRLVEGRAILSKSVTR